MRDREREPEMGREDDRETESDGEGRTPFQQVGVSMVSSTVHI